MRKTSMTKKEADFLKLGKQVQKVCRTPKEWKEFKQYADFYFKKLPGEKDKK